MGSKVTVKSEATASKVVRSSFMSIPLTSNVGNHPIKDKQILGDGFHIKGRSFSNLSSPL